MTTLAKRKRNGARITSNQSFTLILTGIVELTDAVQDALFEAGCDDALLGIREGVPFLNFDREAVSLRDAVLSAIHDVERAGIGAQVIRVEPDDLVNGSEIARRTGRTRESVRQLATGKRGPGGFPPPISGLTRRSPLWRWTEVVHWLADHDLFDRVQAEIADTIAAINAALDLRRHVPAPVEMSQLCREIGVARAVVAGNKTRTSSATRRESSQ